MYCSHLHCQWRARDTRKTCPGPIWGRVDCGLGDGCIVAAGVVAAVVLLALGVVVAIGIVVIVVRADAAADVAAVHGTLVVVIWGVVTWQINQIPSCSMVK